MSERDRYQFIVERDSEEAALEFAERTYKSYRSAVLQTGKGDRKFHHASLPQYRRCFIESYLYLKNKVLSSIT